MNIVLDSSPSCQVYLKYTMFWKLDLLPLLGVNGGTDPTLLDPVDGASAQ
jgi:hypothetical protein